MKTTLLFLIAFIGLSCVFPVTGLAHPEDEICTPDSGIDPALCKALNEIDRSTPGQITEISLERPLLETIVLYTKVGFIHILPKGYDHILFVLALFLGATNRRELLVQISTFTVAHTITLGMATAGYISVPAHIVEPLIALSIAFVAFENVYIQSVNRWRTLVIFLFGLFHGLGFAGVFGDLGLATGDFLTTLISFNIGVELGQLTVIVLAALAAFGLRKFFKYPRTDYLYMTKVVFPGSYLIGILGFIWFFDRLF